MTLSPAQQLRRKNLLAKKELRNHLRKHNAFLNQSLRFPLLIEHVSFEANSQEKPDELQDAGRVQRITLSCSHITDLENMHIESWSTKVDLWSTEVEVPVPLIYSHGGGLNLAEYCTFSYLQPDPWKSRVVVVGIFYSDSGFQFGFSDSAEYLEPNVSTMPLLIRLQPSEMVFAISDNGQNYRRHIDLRRLAEELSILRDTQHG